MINVEIADKSLLVGNRSEKLIEFVEEYRKRLRKGLNWLQEEPRSQKEADQQFSAKQKLVDAIAQRVNVFEDKSIEVVFVLDLSDEEIKEAPLSWR